MMAQVNSSLFRAVDVVEKGGADKDERIRTRDPRNFPGFPVIVSPAEAIVRDDSCLRSVPRRTGCRKTITTL